MPPPCVCAEFFVDFPAALRYNRACEYAGQSRGHGESPSVRKVRAPQGEDSG